MKTENSKFNDLINSHLRRRDHFFLAFIPKISLMIMVNWGNNQSRSTAGSKLALKTVAFL